MNKMLYSNYDFSKIPFDEIVHVGQRSLIYRDTFCISWLLGRYCNYNCSYCWPHSHSKQKDHRPLSLLVSTIDEIKRQSRERGYNSFHLSLSGGEPTMHPDILPFLKHYADDVGNCNNLIAALTTNLSPGLVFWEKLVSVLSKIHHVSVTASWHREAGERNLQEHKKRFAEKLLFLQSNNVWVTINITMVPQIFEQLWEEALFFHELGLNVTLKPQSNPGANNVVEGYTSEQLQKMHTGFPQMNLANRDTGEGARPLMRPWIEPALRASLESSTVSPQTLAMELKDREGKKWYIDQAERLNSFNFNRFKDWTCESGYRSIIIREPSGDIMRSHSCHDAPIGNILTGFQLFDKPIKCSTPTCLSSADGKIPKYRENNVSI